MHKNGFTLIEVLISMAIFSFGLLSLLHLQTTSIQFAYSALLESQAEIAAVSLAEELSVTSTPVWPAWNKELTTLLPQADSQLTEKSISLSWVFNATTFHLNLPIAL